MNNLDRKHSLRDVCNANFSLLRTGCQWRMRPGVFPIGNWVITISSNGRTTGSLSKYMNCFVTKYAKTGKYKSLRLACIDSQTIKTTRLSDEYRGFQSGKMIKERMHHINIDKYIIMKKVLRRIF